MEQQEKTTKVEELRGLLARLHAERGGEVQLAREIREAYGVLDDRYAARWAAIHELTERICAAEAELQGIECGADESGMNADILIAVAVAARDALVYAEQLLSDNPEAKRSITNIIDAVDALMGEGQAVAHA